VQLLWQCALDLLQAREDGGALLQAGLEAHLRRTGLAPGDKHRARTWVLDVMRWQAALDALIAWRTGGHEEPRPVHQLLRLALAQLCFTRQFPPPLVVTSALGFARASFKRQTAVFLRHELEACARSLSAVEDWLRKLRVGRPDKGYSHPFWLVERWTRQFGRETAHRLLAWNNSPAPAYARVNTFKTTAAALQQQWQAEGVRMAACQWEWTGPDTVFELAEAPELAALASWRQGWFVPQEPASLLPGRLLELRPGDVALDFCAGAGLSTAWLAQLGGGAARLHAENGDHGSESPQPLVTRLGVTGVKLAGKPFMFPEPGGRMLRFDKVLVQPPGSGTATLRQDVDRRWTLTPTDIETWSARQVELLREVAPRVKIGGWLVYGSSSAEAEENQQVVARFLEAHRHFRLDCERQLLPGQEGVDGVYAARLVCAAPACQPRPRVLVVMPELPPAPAVAVDDDSAPPLEPLRPVCPAAPLTRYYCYAALSEGCRLALRQKPTPQPGPEEVLVRMYAAGLGRREWLLLQGLRLPPKPNDGVVAGTEGAGEVVAVGAQARPWRIGERVLACPYSRWGEGAPNRESHKELLGVTRDGTFSEYAVLPAGGLVRLPETLSFVEGAGLPVTGLSAWIGLIHRGQLQPGARVLIVGLGGIGVWALQIALATGAKVVAISRSESKRQRALALGAVRTFAPDDPKWWGGVSSWTHHWGVQHLVLAAGPELVTEALGCLGRAGQAICFGAFACGSIPFNPAMLAHRQARLDGVSGGSQAQLQAFGQWLAERKIRPAVGRVFNFPEVNDAVAYLAGGEAFGKVVIRVQPEPLGVRSEGAESVNEGP
jgi:NADPH:quinone reductase-like Zn-dependent oxidoreductase/16S rRNA C967 or C1407 C5-methylase (RsmB/RsmF family)